MGLALFVRIAQAGNGDLRHPYQAESAAIPVAFFDADYTLRITRSGRHWPAEPSDMMILPGVREKIAELTGRGYFVAIVSNQRGAAHALEVKQINAIFDELSSRVERGGGKVHAYFYAVNNEQIKPSAYLGTFTEATLKAAHGENAHIDLSRSFMVGDAGYRAAREEHPVGDIRPDGRPGQDFENFDRLFAEKIGVTYVEPNIAFGWTEHGHERILDQAQYKELVKSIWAKRASRRECPAQFSLLNTLQP